MTWSGHLVPKYETFFRTCSSKFRRSLPPTLKFTTLFAYLSLCPLMSKYPNRQAAPWRSCSSSEAGASDYEISSAFDSYDICICLYSSIRGWEMFWFYYFVIHHYKIYNLHAHSPLLSFAAEVSACDTLSQLTLSSAATNEAITNVSFLNYTL